MTENVNIENVNTIFGFQLLQKKYIFGFQLVK